MKTQPIYTTAKSHVVQATTVRKKRRRIGTMPERLKKELNAMDKFERVRIGIAVSMAMVTLLNQ